jgi:hypothetical protein
MVAYGPEFESHPGGVGGDGTHIVDVLCLHADNLEPNDTRAEATDATSFIQLTSRWVSGTIYPAGNDDWYKLADVDLEGKNILLFTYRSQTVIDVFKNGAQVATATRAYTTSLGAADWEVRVYGPSRDNYFLEFNTSLSPAAMTPRQAAAAMAQHAH